jgi:soluble lytic murein transglycosylase-like protein
MTKENKYLFFGIGAVALIILAVKPTMTFIANARLNQYKDLITFYAQMYELPPQLVEAVCLTESSGDTNSIADNGQSGGLMNVWLPTARSYGFAGTVQDLTDPSTGLNYGCAVLSDAYKQANKNLSDTYAIYNDGQARKDLTGKYVNSKGVSIQAHVDNFNNNFSSLSA